MYASVGQKRTSSYLGAFSFGWTLEKEGGIGSMLGKFAYRTKI